MAMKVYAFLQARMSSTRLPGKVLKAICGKPMILHQIDRLKTCNKIDHVVVLTSSDASDDALYEICKKNEIECFRGSLNNVLERFKFASDKYDANCIVRLTADCPLMDWDVVDDVVSNHLLGDFDYTSNTIKPTYPDGLDVEVFSRNCLVKMYGLANKPEEKEHVTLYCYTHEKDFRLHNVINKQGDKSNFRWTVDTNEDFEFVTKIYDSLYPKNKLFNSKDIYKFIEDNSEILELNNNIIRNEGWYPHKGKQS